MTKCSPNTQALHGSRLKKASSWRFPHLTFCLIRDGKAAAFLLFGLTQCESSLRRSEIIVKLNMDTNVFCVLTWKHPEKSKSWFLNHVSDCVKCVRDSDRSNSLNIRLHVSFGASTVTWPGTSCDTLWNILFRISITSSLFSPTSCCSLALPTELRPSMMCRVNTTSTENTQTHWFQTYTHTRTCCVFRSGCWSVILFSHSTLLIFNSLWR